MSDDNGRKCWCGLEPCVCREFPEPYTRAYFNRRFAGNERLLNMLAAEYVDSWKAVKELRQRVDSLEAARQSDMAEIGRLSAELEAAKESIVKAREAFRGIRKQVTTEVQT